MTNCSASLFIQINYINPHKEDKRPLLTRNVNFVHIHMVYTFFLLYRAWVTGCSKIEGWSKTKRKTAIMRPLKKPRKEWNCGQKNKLTILIDPYYNILYVYSICIRKISQMTRWSDYIISRAPVFLFQALKIQLYLVFRLVRSMN